MAVSTHPMRAEQTQTPNLVEMSWDPITRIVGSLGIDTKIDGLAAVLVDLLHEVQGDAGADR